MLVLDLLSTPALFVRALHHHVDPMSHHCIDQHVEDGWGQRVPLHHPPEYLERRPIVPLPAFATTLSLHHYVQRNWKAQGTTLYPSRIYRHLDLYMASHALCRSIHITYRTSSFKADNC